MGIPGGANAESRAGGGLWPTIRGLRWWIVGLVFLGTIANYVTRNSLAVMAPQLKSSLHFNTQQYSYVVAAFQVAYTVMQPVCGFLVDKLGLRLSFTLFAVIWSITGALHAAAGGWPSLAVFRGLLGITQASAIPAGVKAVAEWFPRKERSVGIGYFNAGTSFGAAHAAGRPAGDGCAGAAAARRGIGPIGRWEGRWKHRSGRMRSR